MRKAKQRLISEETINWDNVYINYPGNKVIIFKNKEKDNVRRVLTIDKFNKLMKKVPNINFLILLTL